MYNDNIKVFGSIQGVGMVTFLDVLGWKGIYKNDRNAIKKLNKIIDIMIKTANEDIPKHVLYMDYGVFDMENKINIKILSISDTIVIVSYIENYNGEKEPTKYPKYHLLSFYIHSLICEKAIRKGIEIGIFLRGATSTGKFEYKDNIFLGEAIDEAADWHEQTDWIGLILSPKASMYFKILKNKFSALKKIYSFQDVYSQVDKWICYEQMPLKDSKTKLNICLNWVNKDIDLIMEKDLIFFKVGSLTRDIASKYINTFNFIDDIKKKQII